MLFAAASTGGAYNSGGYGAYGRLAAWQSLAGLSGAAEGASAAEVEAGTGGATGTASGLPRSGSSTKPTEPHAQVACRQRDFWESVRALPAGSPPVRR
ncbi:DUF6183 family protein [Streptomyces spiramyceticus]|uniref:DUF6183 family protein n=1 Tax=Streptomyces spiramyceticus TaxID=299717 RepID=UPI00237C354D|nr:DUF6183 family protein [Streptomyces spiramyceticus]